MELFGYVSLIGVGLFMGMMCGTPARRDSKFSTSLWHLFLFSIPISRLSLSLVWQGPCADRVQRDIRYAGAARPGSAVGKIHVVVPCRLASIHKIEQQKKIIMELFGYASLIAVGFYWR